MRSKGDRLRVLYVEDHLALRRSVIRALPSFEWIEASSREQALQRLLPHPHRLLIDVQLGDRGNTDGLLFLDDVRDLELDIPAIILSAHLDFERTLYAREHNAVAFPKSRLVVEKLHAILEDPFGHAAESESMSLAQLASHLRRLALPVHDSIPELRRLAISGELDDNDGNVSATARATGYTRTHIGRFKPKP